MNLVSCPNCNKEFKFNCHLIRHLNGKKKCKRQSDLKYNCLNDNLQTLKNKYQKLSNQINLNDNSYKNNECVYCFKTYTTKRVLVTHHEKSCKNRQKLQEQLILLENLIKKHKVDIIFKKSDTNTIKSSKNKSKNITNNTINNNNNIKNNIKNITNNNLNININPFGQEDLSHITLKDYKKYLSGFFPGFVEYIKKIHYDDEMPSNHNIYISNLNSKYAYVYKDDKWNVEKKESLVDNIVSKKMLLLDAKCDELEKEGSLTDKIIHNHNSFEKNYKNGGDESEKYLADDIMLLLYNNRDKIDKLNKDSQELVMN
jgi:hypothetical protein